MSEHDLNNMIKLVKILIGILKNKIQELETK
jgi:hypothetical protein